jgi:hypothetical protein
MGLCVYGLAGHRLDMPCAEMAMALALVGLLWPGLPWALVDIGWAGYMMGWTWAFLEMPWTCHGL